MAEYNGEPGFFIKVWVIDDTKNDNGWHVSRESILPGMKTALEPRFFSPEWDMRSDSNFKNVAPLISMPDYQDPSQRGHPSPYGKDIITRQAPHRVGNFIAVGIEDDYNSGIRYGWAIIKIFNEKIQEEINNGDDIFFSPSLMPLRTVNGIDTEWRFNHHAIVDQPAYGSKAHMLGRCTGGSQCVHMLAKQAKSLHVQAVHGGCTKVCDNALPSLSDPLLQVRQANTLPSLSDPLLTVAQQAAKEEETWITVKGTPVKIEDGQTKEDAVKDFLAKKEKSDGDKKKIQMVSDDAIKALASIKDIDIVSDNERKKFYMRFKTTATYNKFIDENKSWVERNFKTLDDYRQLVPKMDKDIGLADKHTFNFGKSYKEYAELVQQIDQVRAQKNSDRLSEEKLKISKNYTKLNDAHKKTITTLSKVPIAREEDGTGKFNSKTIATNIAQNIRPPTGMSDADFTDAILAHFDTKEPDEKMTMIDRIRAEKLRSLKYASKDFYDTGDKERFQIMAEYEGMKSAEINEIIDNM